MIRRRDFIRSGLLGAAGLTIGGLGFKAGSYRSIAGSNNEIRVAVLGMGNRGLGYAIPQLVKLPGVKIVAVCDPDRERLALGGTLVFKSCGYKPDEVVDLRHIMDRKDVDLVSVDTMQYWHALPVIWACEAGKDVYVEKPLSHFIWEGRQMVNAARKYNRIVQVGMQSRSFRPAYDELLSWLREGSLGKILYALCFSCKPRHNIGKRSEPLPIPKTLDYDLWCGYTSNGPIYRDKIQYDCSFTWDKGDGESVNQGVHQVDDARWVLGYTGLPPRTMSIGGRFLFNDAGDVPNMQISCLDYPEAPIFYVCYNLPANKEMTGRLDADRNLFRNSKGYSGVGVHIQCENGYVFLPNEDEKATLKVFDSKGNKTKEFTGEENHYSNLLYAMRERNRELLNADILEGHRSTILCHAANISLRLGSPAPVAEQKKLVDECSSPYFQEIHDHYVKHLEGLGIDPGTSSTGPWLECDPERESFRSNPGANEFVKGHYRKEFMVPEVRSR